MGVYILLGGMVAFATIVGVLDLVAERRERAARKERKHA